MKLSFRHLLLSLVLIPSLSFGQRVQRTINESWAFHHGNGTKETIVDIPHTWNNVDAADEAPGYYRGACRYVKTINIPESSETNQIYLHFEGANQVTRAKVNGKAVGEHIGGYSAFCFDITDAITSGANLFEIEVDNSHNADIPPLSADFTFFGGIYRDISLIITPKVHLSTTHYATSGVYIDTADEDKATSKVRIRTFLSNDSDKNQKAVLSYDIFSPAGEKVASHSQKVKIGAKVENLCAETTVNVNGPELWSMETPNIYRVVTRLEYEGGKDGVTEHFGFRWFSFDPKKGFFLNGEHKKLIGTNRHQDFYAKGNALRDEMHESDMKLMKEMGSNFLRISHYPQDPIITQMCDRMGIVSSVEIPIVNAITMTPEFRDRCVEMMREMIWQDYNSPSVVMWAYMNEVMLRPPYDKKDEDAKKEYMAYLFSIASDIEKTIKDLDPTRYTMLPCNANANIYIESGIAYLPDILGWNVYNGWYGRTFENLQKFLDKLPELFPDQTQIISEYGADVDPRLHSFDSERFDFTCEFGLKFHKYYIPNILSREWLAGAAIWNLNDFYSEGRQDAVPRINNKGITGVDRELKDSYHLYRAWLRNDPFIKIGCSTWKYRGGVVDAGGVCRQSVEVYTNAPEVEMFLNGTSLGRQGVNDRCAVFEVPFTSGENVIMATAQIGGKSICDMMTTRFDAVPDKFADAEDFVSMNVMLGSKRYFEDRDAQMVWIPEKEYTEGSWGYVGGSAYRAKTRHGSLPASDLEIIGTSQDPIFQTQRVDIEAFKADVPDGKYYVYLYFAEYESNKEHETLAYNLGNDVIRENSGARVFNVDINGTTVLDRFEISRECGAERAMIKKFTVNVTDGKGLTIDFTPVSGKTVLNAVRIYRCF